MQAVFDDTALSGLTSFYKGLMEIQISKTKTKINKKQNNKQTNNSLYKQKNKQTNKQTNKHLEEKNYQSI